MQRQFCWHCDKKRQGLSVDGCFWPNFDVFGQAGVFWLAVSEIVSIVVAVKGLSVSHVHDPQETQLL